MQKITSKLTLCLAIILALAACAKENKVASSSKETKPQETNPKTNQNQDGKTDKDNDTNCKPGFFGPDCKPCTCSEHGACNDGKNGDGTCTCEANWKGANCDESDTDTDIECAVGSGKFGENCENCTCQHGTCNDGKEGNGKCTACDSDKWTGDNCDKCKNNKLGTNCDIDRVDINGQIWTNRNMDVTVGNDGNQLTCYVNDFAPQNELPDFVKNYGCLYMWEDAVKVCPAGWHLPDKEEFEALLTYVGGVGTTKSSQNLRATSFKNGSDTYGFGALPAGFYTSGFTTDQYFGKVAEFWSATEDEKNKNWAYNLTVTINHFGTILDPYMKDQAYSVRCLKDAD